MSLDLFGQHTTLPVVYKGDWPPDHEEKFWATYPRKISKLKAMQSLAKVRESGVEWARVIGGVRKYAAWLAEAGPGVWRPHPKHPTTWLNQGCWDDVLQFGPSQTDGPRNGGNAATCGAEDYLRSNRERARHGRREGDQEADRARLSGPAVS